MTHSISILSPTQSAVVHTVERFGQVTASQLRRLHYEGTPRGIAVRSSRHLKRLTEQGFIRRLPYKQSGWGFGSGEYVYTKPDSRALDLNRHTLDITELHVQLIQTGVSPIQYLPEPWSHNIWGGKALQPDAYVKLPDRHFFVEVDRSTEYAAALSKQMNAYISAFYGMDGGSFPQVLFVAHFPDRVAFIRREAAKKKVAGLFEVCLFDDAVKVMCA